MSEGALGGSDGDCRSVLVQPPLQSVDTGDGRPPTRNIGSDQAGAGVKFTNRDDRVTRYDDTSGN